MVFTYDLYKKQSLYEAFYLSVVKGILFCDLM